MFWVDGKETKKQNCDRSSPAGERGQRGGGRAELRKRLVGLFREHRRGLSRGERFLALL